MFEKIITKRFRRNTIMFFYNISYFNLGVVDNDDLFEDNQKHEIREKYLYFRQLATLVKERHEAFAKLKTAEDLLEATRSENEILRKNLPALSTGAVHSLQGKDSMCQVLYTRG
jgi:hypothetical protein